MILRDGCGRCAIKKNCSVLQQLLVLLLLLFNISSFTSSQILSFFFLFSIFFFVFFLLLFLLWAAWEMPVPWLDLKFCREKSEESQTLQWFRLLPAPNLHLLLFFLFLSSFPSSSPSSSSSSSSLLPPTTIFTLPTFRILLPSSFPPPTHSHDTTFSPPTHPPLLEQLSLDRTVRDGTVRGLKLFAFSGNSISIWISPLKKKTKKTTQVFFIFSIFVSLFRYLWLKIDYRARVLPPVREICNLLVVMDLTRIRRPVTMGRHFRYHILWLNFNNS